MRSSSRCGGFKGRASAFMRARITRIIAFAHVVSIACGPGVSKIALPLGGLATAGSRATKGLSSALATSLRGTP